MNAISLKNKLQETFESGKVIALKGSDYEGLGGYIDDILVGDERQTENDCFLDIIVTFDEPSHLNETHPHLNGTTISHVIMGEDELGFYMNEEDELAETLEGKAVCPSCFVPLNEVVEIQHDIIQWTWDEESKTYLKDDNIGDSDRKRCGVCDVRIDDDMMHKTYFQY